MATTIIYRIVRTLVDGRTQYLNEYRKGERAVWTRSLADSLTFTAAGATAALADAKVLDSKSGSTEAIHEYAIQPFSHLDPVPGPLAVSAPLSDPAVVVSRQLVGPLGDALRLAQAAGKLDQLAAMVATGGPLTADQLASVLS